MTVAELIKALEDLNRPDETASIAYGRINITVRNIKFSSEGDIVLDG
jgi:hypothetical protein